MKQKKSCSKIASRKAKGRNLQKWVCQKIADLFDIIYDQQDDTCPIHSREMGQSGTDVCIRSADLKNKFIYDIECKNTESVSLYNWIKQAQANTETPRQWLVVHKKNHSHPIVILDAVHFFELLKNIK